MVSRGRKLSRNKIDAILVPKYFVYRAIPCQLDQNFKGWPISGSDETFPDERYVWDKIILFHHKLIIRSKVMAPQSWHGKLKIGKTKGVRQLGCIFGSQ